MLSYDIRLLRTSIEYLYVPVNLSMPRNRVVLLCGYPLHIRLTPDICTPILQTIYRVETELGRVENLQNLEYPEIRYDAHAQGNCCLQSSSKLHYDQLPYKYYSYIRNIMQCSMATKEIQTIIAQYEVHRFSDSL